MKTTMISVTDAARNFADCINRARYQKAAFTLLKNGTPVAQILPVEEKTFTGRDFAKILARVRLSREDEESWQRDLRAARKRIQAPADKWR
jgi:prevent-host-death family protein